MGTSGNYFTESGYALYGSSLFSMSGEAEACGGEVEHGDEVVHRAVTAGFTSHGGELAV